MDKINLSYSVVVALTLSGCASTRFVSTWKAPDAKPLEPQGSKVAAVVMMSSEASRRVAEDTLAREITARGAHGVPMYVLAPGVRPSDEATARSLLERANVRGVVVLRPVGIEKRLVASPVSYSDPIYGGYWGGYYAYGWENPWGTPVASDVYTETRVSIETLIYSLAQNKLVWGGQSTTTDARSVDQLVTDVAEAAAEELQHEGLIAQ